MSKISKKYRDWRKTRDYRIWRAGVIRRDKRCQICNSLQNRHAHHIDSGSYFPELRFKLENGICLCKGCHIQYHTNFNRSYRVKTTRYNLENFKALSKYMKELFNGKI